MSARPEEPRFVGHWRHRYLRACQRSDRAHAAWLEVCLVRDPPDIADHMRRLASASEWVRHYERVRLLARARAAWWHDDARRRSGLGWVWGPEFYRSSAS